MELPGRLFVAAVATFGPTLLFLGLWRGLMRARDGELVERVCDTMDEAPSGVAVGAPTLKREAGTRVLDHRRAQLGPDRRARSPAATRRVECGRCGHENVANYEYCRECRARLPDE